MNKQSLVIGSWNRLPHIAVHGDKVMFYVWINENGNGTASKWISGQEAFEAYNKLSNLIKKDKKAFISMCKDLRASNRGVK